jgi:hypothetical protein
MGVICMQQQIHGDMPGEAGGAAAGRQQEPDDVAKSYRYLRLAMVGLLVCLAAAVFYQTLRQGGFLTSVSAYYYTPAQAIFVGALIGLGACMIALKRPPVEDVSLNLGGVFATVVAIVPTVRGADYQAAVRACREANTPLLTERGSGVLDCPTVQALADATKANVENNLVALLAVGFLALVASVLFARRDGVLSGEPDGRARRSYLVGLAVASIVWAAGLLARLLYLQWFVDNAHYLAAAGLFLCILVVAIANARRFGGVDNDSSRMEQAKETVGVLVRPGDRKNKYSRIALTMIVIAFVAAGLLVFHVINIFWLEIVVALIFIVFWTVQTIELD